MQVLEWVLIHSFITFLSFELKRIRQKTSSHFWCLVHHVDRILKQVSMPPYLRTVHGVFALCVGM